MRYIPQKHLENLRQLVAPGKVVVICGARRVGKTTLVKEYLKGVKAKSLFVDGDDIVVREYLESQSISKLRDFVGDHTLLVVDEAQHVEKIGLNLKLIVDHIPTIRIVATGYSTNCLSETSNAESFSFIERFTCTPGKSTAKTPRRTSGSIEYSYQ